MAVTTYGVNDSLTNKLWAKTLDSEMLKETFFGRFMGESASNMIQLKSELQKSAGDRVTVGLRMQLTGEGATEAQVMEGNEEALTTYSDDLYINELVHAVRHKGDYSIDSQRVLFSMREEAKDGLKDWFAAKFDQAMFYHLAGYTLATDARQIGNNAVSAAAASRIVRATGSDDATVNGSSGSIMTLTMIDKCVEAAKTATPLIRPVSVEGQKKFLMFLHPYQVYDLRTNTNAGQWLDIQKAVYMGSRKSNPIYDGSLGEYNNVILYESTRLPNGISNAGAQQTSTRRAVFCGAQAGLVGFGQKFSEGRKFRWVEDSFDYGRELGVSAQTVWGIKKARFNSVDFGAIACTTYAVAHT